MNLIKNLMTTQLPLVEKPLKTSQRFQVAEMGLCVTCSNKPHCVWLENNKQVCEHFE